jgi:Laminin G domain
MIADYEKMEYSLSIFVVLAFSRELSQKTNQYMLRFSTTADSGVLLIQSKGQTVRDDYLVIAVVRGHVEAGYNLGKQGPSNLFSVRSTVYVSDGEWHTVVFTR